MKLAIIGSRTRTKNFSTSMLPYIPANTTEIISGGAMGIDRAAEEVAIKLAIPTRVFHPDYQLHGQRAPLIRNHEIIEYTDQLLAFWDGQSRGTMHTIVSALNLQKPVRVVLLATLLKASAETQKRAQQALVNNLCHSVFNDRESAENAVKGMLYGYYQRPN